MLCSLEYTLTSQTYCRWDSDKGSLSVLFQLQLKLIRIVIQMLQVYVTISANIIILLKKLATFIYVLLHVILWPIFIIILIVEWTCKQQRARANTKQLSSTWHAGRGFLIFLEAWYDMMQLLRVFVRKPESFQRIVQWQIGIIVWLQLSINSHEQHTACMFPRSSESVDTILQCYGTLTWV